MRSFITARSKYDVDSDVIFNMPFYETGLKENSFVSYDSYSRKMSALGTTWTTQGRSFPGTVNVNTGVWGIADLTAYSIEIWFNVPDQAQHHVLIGGGYYSLNFYCPANEPTVFGIYRADANYLWKPTGLTDYRGLWTQIFLSMDTSRNLSVYQNSNFINTNGVTTSSGTNLDLIGGNVSPVINAFMIGTIGEIVVYNTTYDQTGVTNKYLAKKWRYGL